ncbi:DUF2627 domain-containing protein [Paenibacillus popilliae]|uniref:DUF2627 domain-containing protein n=1 Tax=Paenibacillus popilliae ATCC 14706 TaxID=1212764 RepID=M9M7J8_PAEPP|nr:DUF2627 domain-containing protein [Paenibacillus popilliae]GAC43708.1 hypothetical protein PPOP_3108 [Paenibacillus popilliae ATCC 14706]
MRQDTQVIARFFAILLLVIPGLLATFGFLTMKNVIFDYIADCGNDGLAAPSFGWLPFLGGFIMFAIGVAFIGGWVFYRDRKRNYVASRFRKKKGLRPASFKPMIDQQNNARNGSSSEPPASP